MTQASEAILCLGELTHDEIGTCTALSSDASATFLTRRVSSLGGRGANFAAFASALGCPTILVAAVGADFDGSSHQQALRASGVDTSRLLRSDRASTPRAFVFSDPDRSRTYFDPGVLVAEEQAFSEHVRNLLAARLHYRAAYCTSWLGSLNERFTAEVDAGFVAYAPGHEAALHEPAILRACLARADLLLLNRHEAAILERRLGAEALSPPRIVAITRGADGVELRTDDDRTRIPAVTGGEVRDPTGGGDGFAAAFVVARLRGANPLEACRFGVAAASLAIEDLGCQTRIPTLPDVLARYRSAFGDPPSSLHRETAGRAT